MSSVFLALKYAASVGGPTLSKLSVNCSANPSASDGRPGWRAEHKIEKDDCIALESHPANDERSLSVGTETQEIPSAFTIVVPSDGRGALRHLGVRRV